MSLVSKDKAPAILITGASGGIGLATLIACLKENWHVFAACRDEKKLKETLASADISASDIEHHLTVLTYDVSDQEAVKQAFRQIQQSPFSLYGLVNNAGVMLDSMLGMTSLAQFEQQLLVNVTACFQHLQLASRLMTKQKQGSIINVSSVVGLDGASGQVAYSTSKAALLGMTKSAAKELAKLNIRVNAVAPGFIETPLTDAYQDEKRQAVLNNVGMKRAGTANEIAATIVHLLRSDSAYITGQCIRVDGLMTVA
ncbi:SDR family NAD(P)-dependent oxidoreductase [Brumicola blandensis]|jgi:3-oxoacyl-[acyl-carrier protein] reductase|uniref:SDR family oxidoreductase n=1 Tax=Brumicola blandensis TaxID=3075611 RepID=A0AAW8R0M0_9ALTE|nr:SDR family oxidoreductase [Alteromonas sp. W409]MDT0582822.1 SDR family oxidoreductase [Alteromonas sp. W409]